MKSVYSNRTTIYLSIIGLLIFSSAMIICIFSLIDNIMNNQPIMIIINSISLFVFVCFIVLFLFILNRFGCKILYDEDEKQIIRKGFICGYKYQLKIEDIKEIIVATFPKKTTYYVLIDSYNTKYDGGYKKSFIRIEKNKKNQKFIRQFWNKPIKTINLYF